MRPEDVVKVLQRRPFQPFRIHLSNGRTYEVRHPELVLVSKSALYYFIPAVGLGMPMIDDYEVLSLLHVNNLEPLPQPSAASGNGPAAE